MASHRSRSLAEAAPSVPRATGTPAASSSGVRAKPLASFWLDAGQWATVAPATADQLDVAVGQVDAVGEDRARSEQAGVAQHLDRRAAVAVAHQAELGDRLGGVHVDPGAVLGRQGGDRRQLVLVEEVRAVGADPPAVGVGGGEEVGGPGQAFVERAVVGSGELDEDGPAAQVEPGRRRAAAAAASGKKYMSSADVVPASRHSAMASVVPAATVSSESREPSAGSSRVRKRSRSRSSASPRNMVIARWVWALTRPGHDECAAGVDRAASVDGLRRRRADVGDHAAVDQHRGAVVDGAGPRPS